MKQQLRFGFTLIEVLVVAVITVMLVLSGLAIYARFNERQKVSQAGLDLVTQLRVVQKRADAGERSDGCGMDQLHDYELSGVSGEGFITVKADCDEGGGGTIYLRNGSMLGADFGGIQFKTLTQDTLPGTIIITSPEGNCRIAVSVDAGGTIDTGPVTCL